MKALIFLLVMVATFTSFGSMPKMPVPDKPVDQMTKNERKAYSKKRQEFLASLTPDQRQEYREQKRNRRIAEEGGIVRITNGDMGHILIINTCTNISSPSIDKMLSPIRYGIKSEILVENAKAILAPENHMARCKANALIIIEDSASESTILVSPEEKWARINIAKLKGAKLDGRLKRELARTIAYLCGGISSQYHNPLTGFVSDPRMLDDMPVSELPVDVIARIKNYLPQMGISPIVEMTYWQACKAGKAPTPTNDVQKAIWDEVHAIPKNPMKIEFDPKKGR